MIINIHIYVCSIIVLYWFSVIVLDNSKEIGYNYSSFLKKKYKQINQVFKMKK
jgi:NADH:ubiquinone oxidoreductase subunit 6 (subunit J)